MSEHPPALPAISTLSAALANDPDSTLAIAPELMGAEGLPPDLHRQPSSSDVNEHARSDTSHGFGAYQNSSAREEGSRGWSGYAAPARSHSQNPWEAGYRDPPSKPNSHSQTHPDYSEAQTEVIEAEEQEGNPRPPKPRKRARVSKPRQSREGKQNGANDDGVPEEGIFDYAHPSGDYKLGPIFTYPSQTVAQACVRCHKIKRKCDNARPRCAGCSKADVACVFELSPATVSYVSGLKSDNLALTAQIASAAERVQHLESIVANMERGLPPPSEPAHQESTQSMSADEFKLHRADFAGLAQSILGVQSHQLANPVFGAPAPADPLAPNRKRSLTQSPKAAFSLAGQPSDLQPYPPYDTAVHAVETFFVCNAISYPFLEKNEFLRDMDEAYRRESSGERRPWTPGNNDQEANVFAGKEFILYIVIAIGTTNRERMGEVEKGSSRVFKERALLTLQAAISKEDILCVQSLILLGIYSMFDPSDIPLWHVVGFAARVAIALDLHRRVDGTKLPAKVVEQRKRVFYSLYNLDRLVATTLSKPLAISDNDIDVELPSGLPTDSPFRGRPRIEYTQHIIKLRRLLGVILTTVYSVSGTQNNMPEAERSALIMDMHGRLDNWLAECPVPADTEQEKRGMINNHSWFLLNYHQGLCLLYRPSPLYPVMTMNRLSALHEASARCVDLYIDLWHDRKVSYNLINVSMQFLACISLLYCLCEYDNRDPDLLSNPSWRNEVSQRLGQCHDLLDAFSRALPETAKYREIFGTLSDLLLARHGPLRQASTRSASQDHSNVIVPTSHSTTIPMSKRTPTASQASGSKATSDGATTIDPTLTVVPSASADTSAQGQSEGEAWNAMTQLWYNSGDFAFDDRALAAALGWGASNGNGNGNGGAAQNGQQHDSVPLATALTGQDGLVQGLWNQLG